LHFEMQGNPQIPQSTTVKNLSMTPSSSISQSKSQKAILSPQTASRESSIKTTSMAVDNDAAGTPPDTTVTQENNRAKIYLADTPKDMPKDVLAQAISAPVTNIQDTGTDNDITMTTRHQNVPVPIFNVSEKPDTPNLTMVKPQAGSSLSDNRPQSMSLKQQLEPNGTPTADMQRTASEQDEFGSDTRKTSDTLIYTKQQNLVPDQIPLGIQENYSVATENKDRALAILHQLKPRSNVLNNTVVTSNQDVTLSMTTIEDLTLNQNEITSKASTCPASENIETTNIPKASVKITRQENASASKTDDILKSLECDIQKKKKPIYDHTQNLNIGQVTVKPKDSYVTLRRQKTDEVPEASKELSQLENDSLSQTDALFRSQDQDVKTEKKTISEHTDSTNMEPLTMKSRDSYALLHKQKTDASPTGSSTDSMSVQATHTIASEHKKNPISVAVTTNDIDRVPTNLQRSNNEIQNIYVNLIYEDAAQPLCEAFVRGRCGVTKCTNGHWKHPYLWQINLTGNWLNVEEDHGIEHKYCDVTVDVTSTVIKVRYYNYLFIVVMCRRETTSACGSYPRFSTLKYPIRLNPGGIFNLHHL
jgi:hypothetical protein